MSLVAVDVFETDTNIVGAYVFLRFLAVVSSTVHPVASILYVCKKEHLCLYKMNF